MSLSSSKTRISKSSAQRGARDSLDRGSILRTVLRTLRRRAVARRRAAAEKPHQLRRQEHNPIIESREDRSWETKATFNPGALYADGRVHLLYRAIGDSDVSVLGYASSADGTTISERSELPAFTPGHHGWAEPEKPLDFSRIAYASGGGWNGGCEDPRLTLLGDKVYLLYTAFDGWGSVRIAMTSIELKDFLDKHWHWKTPALISPPGEIHKNWVLFPEKINGKLAILHSISPRIEIAYFDRLEELEKGVRTIESHHGRTARMGGWDTWARGAGPPPIKTRLGWLLLYHAMDRRDPNRYKLGAMILDLHDPTKVRYRSKSPVLGPDAEYENDGFKAGVFYACGAVVKDGELYVYYGGADSVTCVATAYLDIFLDELKRNRAPKLKTKPRQKVPTPRH